MSWHVALFGFILYGTFWASWTWVAISFPMLGNFSTIIPQIFSHTLSFSLLLWDPYKSNVGAFKVVPEVSETVLISFHSFFFILFCFSYFHHSVFQLSQLFCYWFLLGCFKFHLLCCSLLIACSLVPLGPCKLFLVSSPSLSPFYLSVPASILSPRFWIIFTTITLNSFSGRWPISSFFVWSGGFYHAPSSAACFSVFSFCLICWVWGLLSAGCKVLRRSLDLMLVI